MSVTEDSDSGDSPPLNGVCRIEVRINDFAQLFNSMDPAPFRERVLDPAAEQYIVVAARDLRRTSPLQLVVSLARPAAADQDAGLLGLAVREHFTRRAAETRAKLRRLFRVGRWALTVGLGFVIIVSLVLNSVEPLFRYQTSSTLLQESLTIGSWVALWRPLEIFLYDWWPILGEARLFDRLGAMQVEVVND